jgi:hypothetical protein
VSRVGLLEELERDPAEYRNRQIVSLQGQDVIGIEVVLRAEEGREISGRQAVRYSADQWLWADGVPVSGSTPQRVKYAVARLSVSEFVDDQPESLEPYGLDNPVARIWLKRADGQQVEVWIGDLGEPEVGLEGHPTERRFIADPVYLVGERVLEVVHDLIREGNRKD